MDYGAVISRGWQITWNHKYLWVLGFLAALGSGGGGSAGNSVSQSFDGGQVTPEQAAGIGAFVVGLLCFIFVLIIVIWLVSLVANGGLIGAVNNIEVGEKMTLGQAFGIGTGKLGRLVGVSLLLWLPFIVLLVLIIGLAFGIFAASLGGAAAVNEFGELVDPGRGIFAALGFFGICLAVLACILVPLAIVLNFIYPFALRGAVLQDLGVTDSIRHGWQVLRTNFVEILLLAIIFWVVGLIVSIVLVLPLSLIFAVPLIGMALGGGSIGAAEIALIIVGGLCLALFAALINSVVVTWRSATFTLAYREFTGMTGKAAAVETAV